MGNNRKLQFAIRAVLATAAAAAAVPVALAQTQTVAATTTTESSPVLQEVIVTGTRLSTPNDTSISPITSVSAVDIQNTGLTRVEDVLNNLPMVFAGQNSTESNGGDGTATVDLRGLGPQRTLVLVDGRRLGPGTGDGRNYADLNQIPAALIERVDVLTGGASAVYGADAVAGVVNFILNTHFEGVKIDVDDHFYQHDQHSPYGAQLTAAGDPQPDSEVNTGFGKDVSVVMGSNFADDKGNATAYLTFNNLAPVLQSKYDYSACTLNPVGTGKAVSTSGVACGGSVISKGGYFSAYGHSGTSLFVNTVDQKSGAFRPFGTADEYNYGPLNFYQIPQNRWTGGTFLNYDINSHVNAYMELMATRTTVETQVAPGGYFGETGSHFIPCSNPLLNATEAAAICSPTNQLAQGNPSEVVNGVTYPGLNVYTYRRNVEGGGRTEDFTNDAIRAVVGVKGDFADNVWKYDVYAQHSTVDSTSSQGNYLSNLLIPNALNVITGPALLPSGQVNPNAGKPECTVTYTGQDAACVPWNIWKPGGVTQAALGYLTIPLLINSTVTEEVVDGSVTGDLGKYGLQLPTANSGAQVNIGAEWRSEASAFNPDLEEQLGAAAGAGGPTPPISGGIRVKEVFMESRIPIADMVPGADSLALEGGYRYSDYNLGFKTGTYKVGLDWSPVKDVLFRASYQRAVRAPNVNELYSPQAIGLDFTADPCAGAAVGGLVNGFTAAQCARTGVTAAQFGHINANPSNQYNGLEGGNTDLQPEISTTKAVGVVFKPQFIPNFTTSIDYFQIGIQGDITTVGGGVILQQCLTGGSPLYCDLIHRNATGSLWNSESGYVTDTTINVGSQSTKGFDLKSNYRLPLPTLGSVSFSLDSTRTLQLITQPLTGGPTYDCVGYEGQTCGAGQPKWRSVFSTTWSTPWSGLDLTMRWRYIGAVASDTSSPNPILNKGLPVPPGSNIPSFSYIDLSAAISLSKIVRLQAGVNNVLDKDPPLITGSDCAAVSGTPGAACNGNTWPGSYDSLGRYLYAHVTVQF